MDIYLLSERPAALKEAFSPLSKAKLPLAKAQKPPREAKYPPKEAKTPIEEAFSVSMDGDFPSSAAIFPCRGGRQRLAGGVWPGERAARTDRHHLRGSR
jgi:hypothetical protein